MDSALAPASGSMEKAVSLPKVLTCIFSWLRDEKNALRSLRLVSKLFMATANQFFRIHLMADYAIEHNCIQEAPSIIGGLTFTFPRIITEETDKFNRSRGLEPQDNTIIPDFCSMVARNCVHLAKVKIVLEGPHSEEITQSLSCLFSQNPQTAAVFRIKSHQFIFGSKFGQSVQDTFHSNLPDSCTGLLPTSDYFPSESAFSGLEELRVIKRFRVEIPSLYRILQLKTCPEIASATSFLGPVCWNDMERETRLLTSFSTARPSRTLRIFDIATSICSVNELYALKEQAPGLEEVNFLSIGNTDERITDDLAFERDSARASGTLRLKKLSLMTTEARYAKLLLGRLCDPTVLTSYVTGFIYNKGLESNAAGSITPSDRVLSELLDEMRVDPISGRPQEGFLRELGIKDTSDRSTECVDWLQRLKDTPRLHRLERLSLPLTVDEFLDLFDMPIPLVKTGEETLDVTASTGTKTTATTVTTTTAVMTDTGGEEEGKAEGRKEETRVEVRQQPLMAFPACSSLKYIYLGGCGAKNISEKSGQQFADYLVRSLPRLEHLAVPNCSFTDLTFFNAIAPATLHPSTLSSLPSVSQDVGSTGSLERDHSSSRNSNNLSNTGINRLESLEMSLNFLSRSEFQALPKSEHTTDLIKRRDALLLSHTRISPGVEGYSEYQVVECDLRLETQKMFLQAQPIQIHEGRIEQFLAILDRFQRRKGDPRVRSYVAGMKRLTIHQTGMPDVYVEKLATLIASQFPELDFKISSGTYRFERIRR
ncbi:hypothetical protein EMPS_03746 [Entomortierella parvispora]|uniref:Uncharacterized protein n=1 Tax=Entomortierella parvispora TaxID=205924 RepID=A0A9P3LUQ4_9FUNG|nr:hypothetical protein EMPS_03746 [Entomortierella parvispora]